MVKKLGNRGRRTGPRKPAGSLFAHNTNVMLCSEEIILWIVANYFINSGIGKSNGRYRCHDDRGLDFVTGDA